MSHIGHRRGRAFIHLLLCLWIAFSAACNRGTNTATQVQTTKSKTTAPDFTVSQLNGQSLRLSDYRGKVVLLDFWATWCAPCRDEIPRFVEWQNQLGPEGLQVVGISMDDGTKPVVEFSREFRINYPVAMGSPELARSYGGVLGLPVNIVIGRNGEVKAKHLGMADLQKLKAEIESELQKK